MTRCLLALGSNLGDRHQNLACACSQIAQLPQCQLLTRSSWHGTVPIGGAEGQGEFLNGALVVETSLSPSQLAKALQDIEANLGRERVVRWDARTLDIDVLLFGNEVLDTPALTIPHPRMGFRRFVLEPAAEIAGAMRHPSSGWTIAGLLRHLRESPRRVVVTAAEERIALWLAEHLRDKFAAPGLLEEKKISAQGSALQPHRGIKFPEHECGKPPILETLSPIEVNEQGWSNACHPSSVRPAVTIWLDASNAEQFAEKVCCTRSKTEQLQPGWSSPKELHCQGLGPLARITSDDPATVLQEAEAAIRCVWPDIS